MLQQHAENSHYTRKIVPNPIGVGFNFSTPNKSIACQQKVCGLRAGRGRNCTEETMVSAGIVRVGG
jgi:hypothetical protein